MVRKSQLLGQELAWELNVARSRGALNNGIKTVAHLYHQDSIVLVFRRSGNCRFEIGSVDQLGRATCEQATLQLRRIRVSKLLSQFA